VQHELTMPAASSPNNETRMGEWMMPSF